LLYSVYSLPNIILPFYGGYFVDKLGVRVGILVFTLVIAIGQAIFAFGVQINNFYIALLGRGIFGCGGESQGIAQNAIVFSWFTGKELAMSFGFTLSIAKLAGLLNDIIEPLLYNATDNLDFCFWLGFLICCASLVSAILLILLDKKRGRRIAESSAIIFKPDVIKCSDVKTFGFCYWILCINFTFFYIALCASIT
jgi:MFS family permease